MWVKTIDADWNVEHFDWTAKYDALRKVPISPCWISPFPNARAFCNHLHLLLHL